MKNSLDEKSFIYLIDATAFCYRAFYALRGLSTSWGQPTNAVYGFTNMLNKIIKDKKPNYLAICFDVSRKTFRQQRYALYKIQRPAMPEGLSSQLPFIKEIVEAYRISRFEMEGFEADDIIATLTKRLLSRGLSIVIISSDKDILQLVDDRVLVFNPYKDKGFLYTKDAVIKQFGVQPQEIVDVLALMGDDVDNIPGLPGVGEKTAVELINRFRNLDNLIESIEQIESPALRKTIKDNLNLIQLNRQLLQLNSDVPIEFNLDDLKLKEPDYQRLYSIFKKLEFKRLLKDLPLESSGHLAISETERLELNELNNFIGDELVVVCDYEDSKVLLYTPKKKYTLVPLQEAKVILENEAVKKIGYDLKTLSIFLSKQGIKIKNLNFDIMIADYLLRPSEGDYSLESIVFRHLSIIIRKPDILSSAELVLRLKAILAEELSKTALDELFYNTEIPLIEVLADMEENGVKIDEDTLRKLSLSTEEKIETLKRKIFLEAHTEFNLNSPKQLRYILFEKLNLPIVKKKRTGPSTDEGVLSVLSKQHTIASLILEYRQLIKLNSTYLQPLLKIMDPMNKKIYPNFSQVSTETGRLTCSQPNLQNLPIKTEFSRLVREAVIPASENNWLVSADYSQIELRVLAHLSEDPLLIRSFKEDKDIHRFTASLLYGVDEEVVTEQMRDLAKRVNFGIIYGLSAYGLSQELGISQEEAGSFIEAYFLRYPKVKEFIDNQIHRAEEEGFVTTLLGRRRYLPHIHSNNQNLRSLAQRQAVNTPVQGTAADLIKKAMIDIFKVFKKHNLKANLILQIHDELLFDIGEKDLDFCIRLIKDKMENIWEFSVPIKTVIKKGKNWLQMQEIEIT